MNFLLLIIFAAAGYLIGSISFARLVGFFVVPGDKLESTKIALGGTGEHFESSTVSATTISARRGPRYGCIVAIFDMLKAGLPAYLISLQYPGIPAYFLTYSVFTVIGHNYPLYHGFRGGRGLSPIMGSYFIIDWISMFIAMTITSILGFGILKKYQFGYSGWLFLLIPVMWWRFDSPAYVIFAIAVTVILWFASRPESAQFRKLESSGALENSDGFEGFDQFNVFHNWGRKKKNQKNGEDS